MSEERDVEAPLQAGTVVGTVRMLARFPVKSTAGESLSTALVDERGLVGDRSWAVYTSDGGIASGKTTRRFRKIDGLLRWRSTLPDGEAAALEELAGAHGARPPRHADRKSSAVDDSTAARDAVPSAYTTDGKSSAVHDSTAAVARSPYTPNGSTHRVEDPTAARDIVPCLYSPDGSSYRVDDPEAETALSEAFGQRLTVRPETSVRHHDESGVHLVTAASLRAVEALVAGAVDVRRLRANIVLDNDGVGYPEDAWTDAVLAIGPEVLLRIGPGMPRCVMVDHPQADVSAETPVLRPLGRAHDTLLGVQATVLRTGTVSLGDVARLRRR